MRKADRDRSEILKSPEHIRKALRMWGRQGRSITADLEEMRDTVRTLLLAATRDPESPSDIKARYQVALSMLDALVVESRAIAEQADELLRRKEVRPAEFASLHSRVRLLSAQSLAVTAEARNAAADQTVTLLKPPSKA
jgi:hypothetical protein